MRPRPSVPRLIPLVVLPILLVAACGSAPGRGALRPQGPAATPSTPTRVATPSLEPCPAAAPAARTQLPAVTLRCLGGGPAVPLQHLPARPYIVNVWASWCLPCRREAPRLAAAAATRGQVDFLGVDTADRRASALFFLDYFHIRYPQLLDPNSDTQHRLGAPGIPTTVAVDATGRIVYRRIGEISTAQLTAAMHAADPGVHTGAEGGG